MNAAFDSNGAPKTLYVGKLQGFLRKTPVS